MSGLLIGVDPIIARAGPITLRWFGVCLLVAFVAGLWLTLRQAARAGFPAGGLFDLASWALPAGLVGARLFQVLEHWEYYATHPSEILDLGGGGLVFWGGLATGGLVVYWLGRSTGNLGRIADVAAPGLALGEAIGRFGSFLNGDGQGQPSELPWATQYSNIDAQTPDFGVARHPAQLYQAIVDLVLLGLLLASNRYRLPHGTRFWLWLGLYALSRLALGFVRLDPPFLFGLQLGQLIGLGAIVVSVLGIIGAGMRGAESARLASR